MAVINSFVNVIAGASVLLGGEGFMDRQVGQGNWTVRKIVGIPLLAVGGVGVLLGYIRNRRLRGRKDAEEFEAETFGAESERVGMQYNQVLHGLDKLTITVNKLIKPKRKAVDDLANARDLINKSWNQMRNDGYDMQMFGAESRRENWFNTNYENFGQSKRRVRITPSNYNMKCVDCGRRMACVGPYTPNDERSSPSNDFYAVWCERCRETPFSAEEFGAERGYVGNCMDCGKYTQTICDSCGELCCCGVESSHERADVKLLWDDSDNICKECFTDTFQEMQGESFGAESKCILCGDVDDLKPTEYGYACYSCGWKWPRSGGIQRNDLSCGACGRDGLNINNFMTCSTCGEHFCTKEPIENGQHCVGCVPEEFGGETFEAREEVNEVKVDGDNVTVYTRSSNTTGEFIPFTLPFQVLLDEREADPTYWFWVGDEDKKPSWWESESFSADASTHTFEDLKARQKRGALEKEIAEKNDWVLEIAKANIWEGDNSIKCPNCKDNLNAGWHTRNWEYNQNWSRDTDEERKWALIRFPRGIQCFNCGTMIQMYRDDNAVRGEQSGEWIKPVSSKDVE